MYNQLSSKQRLGVLIILITTVVSLLIHNYLADRHYQVSLGLTVEDSICNINENFNCDNVNTSMYSEFLHVPLAVWGLATCFYFLLLALLAAFGKKSAAYAPYVFYLSAFIALSSVVMGFISLFALGQYCLFCITLYLLSFINLIAVWLTFGARTPAQIPSDIRKLFASSWMVLIFLVLIPLTAQAFHKGKDSHYEEQRQKALKLIRSERENAEKDLIGLLVKEWQKADAFDFDADVALHYGAAQDASKMQIVEFADILCPHCRHAGEAIKAFVDAKTDASWSLLFFPLDGECNKYVGMKTGYRCKLTKTLLCLKDHPKGFDIHEWFFTRQSQVRSAEQADQLINEAITIFKINHDKLNLCLVNPNTQSLIDSFVEQAHQNQVSGTPAIFVNGKKLERGQFIPVLEAVYQKIKEGPSP